MIKPIMKSEFFLRLPSEDAGPEDATTGQDLLDTLHEHEHECVASPPTRSACANASSA